MKEPADVLPPPARKVPRVEPNKWQRILTELAGWMAGKQQQQPLYEYPLKLPVLPPNVRTMAMDDASYTDTTQAMFSYATSNGCGVGFPGYPYLVQLLQRSEYYEPPAVIAGELTRKFVKIVAQQDAAAGTKKRIEELQKAFEDFKVKALWRQLAWVAGGQGRAQLLIDIARQETIRDSPLPIAPETIRKGSLKGLRVVEPMWTSPQFYNSTDPGADDFYKPVKWYMIGQMVHRDRLLTVVPKPVPDLLKPAYNFGGLSLTQLIEPSVRNWLETRHSVNRLINNFSTIKWRTNMEGILQGGLGGQLIKRVQAFINMRDNQGVVLLDKEDEELESDNVPLSGLHELQAQAQEHMAMSTHIPLVKLTGITPAGLNASSDGEIRVFYDWILSEAMAHYNDPLLSVMRILQLHLWGSIDESITLQWQPLFELDDLQKAQKRKADADTDVQLSTGCGAIDADEVRARLIADPDSGYNNLEGEAPGLPELDEPED